MRTLLQEESAFPPVFESANWGFIFSLFCIFVLSCFSPASQAAPLINGGHVAAAISIPGEQDRYEFDATAREYLSISASDIGATSLYLYVTLYRPDGAYLTRSGGYTVSEIYNFRAPATGTYTVLINDASGGNASTGDYLLEYNVPHSVPSNTTPVGSSVTTSSITDSNQITASF